MFVIKVIIEPGKIVYFKDTPFIFTTNINCAYHFIKRENALSVFNDFKKVMRDYDLSIEEHNIDNVKIVYHISDNKFYEV